MTDFFDSVTALFIAGLLNAIVLRFVHSQNEPSTARFLGRVYLWTILLRGAGALLLNVFAADSVLAGAFWGDSGSYDTGGQQLALRWSGEPVASAYLSTTVSGYGWVHFVGAVYYVFGRNQLLVQLINGVFGGVTALVIHGIALRLFGSAAARWATLFMAFFPQVVFWSTGMYKDPSILLCIASAMYAVLLLRDRISLPMVALFAGSVLALMTLRFYVAYFVLFAALATFAFAQRAGAVRTIVIYALLVAAVAGALRVAVPRETLEQQTSYLTLERMQITRQDQAMWSQSGFGQQYDVSTPSGALAALPTGLVYLLFAPFPWATSSLRQILTIPETLVWYSLFPAFFRGLRCAMRTRFAAVLPILVFAGSLTIAYGLMQGNVGTAYRQRTQVTMFYFVFMGLGLAEKRARRESVRGVVPAASR
jgi:4-amino-4-deoxy-L-arabinose transferase-like glycosyltransferase